MNHSQQQSNKNITPIEQTPKRSNCNSTQATTSKTKPQIVTISCICLTIIHTYVRMYTLKVGGKKIIQQRRG